ncbi:GNAT family N-acetyltransferase [Amycolatopsis antarctica]|uniref:GNAT family N-acetyltransferase n=1 Tax=Amycolatopsis antarctica TaxID=1854586 RepID=A0A263D8I6_9PSEU|nr:GNAT family N-acetyltransferase [Amycolatopsis antarctica]OZM74822.1 GNAT family N-acetyltransferase [Amycolatopsis antarctica]
MDDVVIAGEHAARLAAADRLLPEAAPLSSGITFHTESGIGLATTTGSTDDDPDAEGRVLTEHRLDVRLAGPDLGVPLAGLLIRWEEHLTSAATPGDWQSTAVVLRPSRDTAGSAALLRHGFAPGVNVAVRPADRLGSGPEPTPGVCLRPAERADLGTAVDLHLELQRYDAQFGVVTPRSGAAETVERRMSELLAADEPALWIAELYGRALGMVQVELPPSTDWTAPYVRADRVGYLTSLNVAEAARGSGVGTALAAHAHQVFDEAGVDVALLHHALANPRSTPFWAAQGYRPLWTYWYRRPAVR